MEKKYPIVYNSGVPESRLKAEAFYDEEFAKLTDVARRHEVSQEKETWIACYMAGYNAHQPPADAERGAGKDVFAVKKATSTGPAWVKGEYDRLYDILKADPEKRVVCFIDHYYFGEDKKENKSFRDICTIRGKTMEFVSRGHGYGNVAFMPGDEKTNFIKLCEIDNVQWLDESGQKEDRLAWIKCSVRLPAPTNPPELIIVKWTTIGGNHMLRYMTANQLADEVKAAVVEYEWLEE